MLAIIYKCGSSGVVFDRNPEHGQTGDLVYRAFKRATAGGYGAGPEARGGRFSEPHGVAVGPDGSIYLCLRPLQLPGAALRRRLGFRGSVVHRPLAALRAEAPG